ncbi:CPBP family intramembrane glutamic endopeptidase [Maribacter sp. IgM3_T14_3]|uniref:CPBP family intramembrane glutamic endopeptidase n=1 Tax=Maribacter sp. IgM3_T14_3 TaxID=3415140 RepID=UPI003C6F9264
MNKIPNNLKNLDKISKTDLTVKFVVIIVISRSIFLLLAQSLIALILKLNNDQNPWESASSWWTVYGSLVDLGCLSLIIYFLKKENKKISSLLDFDREKVWKDLKIGFIIFLIIFPILGLLYPVGIGMLVFNESTLNLISGQLAERVLPTWAYIYSVAIWWIIWCVIEELTYNGYSLPRLLCKFGAKKALLFIGFFWALQHSFLPFIADWKYISWRFFSFLPLVIGLMISFMKTGRLTPVIIAHAMMDIMAAVWTFKY